MVVEQTPDYKTIGIIGLGPRGLTVLERLSMFAEKLPERSFHVEIYEPNEMGCGVHSTKHPDYLLLNTIACQLTMYPSKETLPGVPVELAREGPDFLSWVNEQVEIRGSIGGLNSKAAAIDFLPRNLLGQYLSAFYQSIYDNIPSNMTISVNTENITDISIETPIKGNLTQQTVSLCGMSGVKKTVDYVVVTTGHDSTDSKYSMLDSPEIGGEGILLEGLGLVAMDKIAEMTVGRGGKFIRALDGTLNYLSSGNEPKIWLRSRGGLPYKARPNVRKDREKHRPILLTDEYIRHLKSKAADDGIDFDTDILPCLIIEMRVAYISTSINFTFPTHQAEFLKNISANVSFPMPLDRISKSLEVYEAKYGSFDPVECLLYKLPDMISVDNYSSWLRSEIECDVNQAAIGIENSPIKATFEVWRDLRDTLRCIVDNNGLDEASEKVFYSVYSKLVNRLVAGPQKERLLELLSLEQANVVHFLHPAAPFPKQIRENGKEISRIQAFLSPRNIVEKPGSIFQTLFRKGIVRSNSIGGVDVNRENQLIGLNGEVAKHMWALGPIVEGSKYYNHYVPSPGAPSKAFLDAHYIAQKISEFPIAGNEI